MSQRYNFIILLTYRYFYLKVLECKQNNTKVSDYTFQNDKKDIKFKTFVPTTQTHNTHCINVICLFKFAILKCKKKGFALLGL